MIISGPVQSQPLQFSTDTAVVISCVNRPPQIPSHYLYNTTDEGIRLGWNRTVFEVPEASDYLMILDGLQYFYFVQEGAVDIEANDSIDLIFTFWHDTILPGDSVIVQIVVYDVEDSLNTAHHLTFIQHCPLQTSHRDPVGPSSIQIYPNPVSDQATIVLPENHDYTSLIILNPSGGRLKELLVTDAVIHLDRDGLSAGLYFIVLRSKDHISDVSKLVIQD